MKGKKWWKIVIAVLGILLIIDVVASFYFYNLAIKRGPKDFLQDNADLEVSTEAMDVFMDGDWRDWAGEQDFESWELTAFDDIQLQGYYLPAEEPTDKTVILSHGYLGNAGDMALYGKYYHEELGYNIFMADARGHGASGGDYIGFGWDDRLDYMDWVDMAIDKLGDDTEILLHGVSMGAATVLMMSGEDLPENVQGIIADSPYTSVYDMFKYQMKRMYHLPDIPFLPTTSLVTQMRAGYSLTEASAIDQVKKAEVPILYIHGNADTFVPTSMSEDMYEVTDSEAELWTVPDAGHGEAFVIAKDTYKKKMNQFLDEYMDGQNR